MAVVLVSVSLGRESKKDAAARPPRINAPHLLQLPVLRRDGAADVEHPVRGVDLREARARDRVRAAEEADTEQWLWRAHLSPCLSLCPARDAAN